MQRTSVPEIAGAERRHWLALYVLDATIVNVALPSIQEDLGFSQNDLGWVVNAYLIAFGGLLLLSGRIGDLIGQRRVFLVGLGSSPARPCSARSPRARVF
jgi:MFS family permease